MIGKRGHERRIPKYRRGSQGYARVSIDGQIISLGRFGSRDSKKRYARIIADWKANAFRLPAREPAPPKYHREGAPKYHRKSDGRACVYIDGRTIHLGRDGTPEARQRYHQVIAAWKANGYRLPPREPRTPPYRRGSDGYAKATIEGRVFSLGRYASPESLERYDRLIAEWRTNGYRLPTREPDPPRYLRTSKGYAIVHVRGRTISLGRHGTPASLKRYERLIADWKANGQLLPPREPRAPRYLLDRSNGGALTHLNGRTIRLGKHASPKSKERFAVLLETWKKNGFRLPASTPRDRTPQYRKCGNRACVRIDGRTLYLGPYGSASSRAEYDRVIAEWSRTQSAPTATTFDGRSMLSARAIADAFGLPYAALRNRLDRYRRQHDGGWTEAGDRRCREEKYLYQVSSVRSIIDELQRPRIDPRIEK